VEYKGFPKNFERFVPKAPLSADQGKGVGKTGYRIGLQEVVMDRKPENPAKDFPDPGDAAGRKAAICGEIPHEHLYVPPADRDEKFLTQLLGYIAVEPMRSAAHAAIQINKLSSVAYEADRTWGVAIETL
jgi:hypothetical protein